MCPVFGVFAFRKNIHTDRKILGDLGKIAAEIVNALETHFALAHKWDCLLLLDYADVLPSRMD